MEGPVTAVHVVLLHLRQLHRLDHLSDGGVGGNEHRMSVLLCQIKSPIGQIHTLLHAGRRQHDGSVISVSTAASQLPVIALPHKDISQSAADPLNIHDDGRQITAAQVGDSLLLQ